MDNQKLREARINGGFTQGQVAEAIGVSRPTYIKMEETDKGITLEQAEILKRKFGIDLLSPAQADRDAIEKFRDMILAVIEYTDSSDGRIPKTKLAKLLYLTDAQWYVDRGSTMSSMVYRRLPQGPVPYEFFQSIDQMTESGTLSIRLKGLAQLIGATESFVQPHSRLSLAEVSLIRKICEKWKDKRTDAIVAHTHTHPTWQAAEDYEPVNMELLRNYKSPVY
jgi:DNA-binding XRE family transcriptional regulator